MISARLGFMGSTIHPEAAGWAARVATAGGSVTATTLAAVDTFCRAVDTANIRDRFFRVNLFCGNYAASLVPLYRGPSPTGTQWGRATDASVGIVSGDYVETGTGGGLNAGATKYLNTGFLPVTAGMSAFDTHMSFYSRSQVTSNSTVLGSFGGDTNAATYQILGFGGINLIYYRSGGGNNSGIEAATWSGANRAGHIMCVRSASNAAKTYRNGTDFGASAAVSDTNTWTPGVPPEIYVFGRNNAGSADQLGFTGKLQGYTIGRAMNDSQASSFYSAMQAFQTSLGRQL